MSSDKPCDSGNEHKFISVFSHDDRRVGYSKIWYLSARYKIALYIAREKLVQEEK